MTLQFELTGTYD